MLYRKTHDNKRHCLFPYEQTSVFKISLTDFQVKNRKQYEIAVNRH